MEKPISKQNVTHAILSAIIMIGTAGIGIMLLLKDMLNNPKMDWNPHIVVVLLLVLLVEWFLLSKYSPNNKYALWKREENLKKARKLTIVNSSRFLLYSCFKKILFDTNGKQVDEFENFYVVVNFDGRYGKAEFLPVKVFSIDLILEENFGITVSPVLFKDYKCEVTKVNKATGGLDYDVELKNSELGVVNLLRKYDCKVGDVLKLQFVQEAEPMSIGRTIVVLKEVRD